MTAIPAHIGDYPLRLFGHKKKLLANILTLIPPKTKTFLEPFGGTGVISWVAKQSGMRVVVNDVLLAAHLRHRALIANNNVLLSEEDLRLLTGRGGKDGIFHERYLGILGEANAAFLDGLAAGITQLSNQMKRDIATIIPCLVAVENLKFNCYHFTSYGGLTGGKHLHGVDMKQEFLDFATNRLPLLVHDNRQSNEAHQMNALDLIGTVAAECVYVDTPYASPAGSYESMTAIWDDWCRYLQGRGHEVKDSYDSKADLPPYTRFDRRSSAILGFLGIFEKAQHIPTVILSYNTTSGIAPAELEGIARSFGRRVTSQRIPYRLPVTSKTKDDYTEEVLITATSRPTEIGMEKLT